MDDLSDPDVNYNESSDEDFHPTAQAAEEGSSSDDDQDAPAKPTRAKGKRKAVADDELDSGDEATIEAARKRRRRKPKGAKLADETEDAEDEELLLLSDHDLIKTRAQRRVELKERKPLAKIDGATVDVDALWAQMLAAPLQPISAPTAQHGDAPRSHDDAAKANAMQTTQEEEQVTVKKIYTFAGQLSEDEKQVPRSSLQQYLADGWKPADAAVDKKINQGKETEAKEDDDEDDDQRPKVRRPLRRPLRFDSNPTGHVRTLPPEHQLSWPRAIGATAPTIQGAVAPVEGAKAARPEKAQKLNVVDKSRLDWTGFVDKEGIAEELDTHGKTKEAYLGRMEFLAGVEAKREEERKKMKTAATAS